ncbi:kinase family protein [Striga asiatica]|uniref:Kinase family protein n=1 Tax=Striga asiatica TaxID=4170 RepID=A0A5A7QW91_STRAF|nr:kinase family protein [Striga asiatica]
MSDYKSLSHPIKQKTAKQKNEQEIIHRVHSFNGRLPVIPIPACFSRQIELRNQRCSSAQSMEGEPDLPDPPPEAKFFNPNTSRPINIHPESINLSRTFNTTCSSTTSSSSSSPPDLVRHVQAAFKRHRPLGMMQTNGIKPRRFLVPQQESSKESNLEPQSTNVAKSSKDDILQGPRLRGSIPQSKISGENHEAASITPPSEWGTTVNTNEENPKPFHIQRAQPGLSVRSGVNDAVASGVEPGNAVADVRRKVHFPSENIASSGGSDDQMATGIDDLLSHLYSLVLTEVEWDAAGNQVDTSAAVNKQDSKHDNFQGMEIDINNNCIRSDGGVSSTLARSNMGVHDQFHQFDNYLQNDLCNAMTQSSVVGSSCATSTLINATSAPMISSTTYCSQHQTGGVQLDVSAQPLRYITKDTAGAGLSTDQSALASQPPISSNASFPIEANDKSSGQSNGPRISSTQDYDLDKDSCQKENISSKGNVIDVKSQPPSSNVPPPDVKLENSKSEKQEKGGGGGKAASTSRRKGYDPDLFFKVNGKLYQRLGKIGSGGSSEVHKVISSDCTIYALKKIKLKGRDYATAYGFCQEIQYLNKLKGKNNIIQLIDYEVYAFETAFFEFEYQLNNITCTVYLDWKCKLVLEYMQIRILLMVLLVTDKTLLQEVMDGSMSNKDSRVKDDGYIYMVLEYGEIDLAHMLAQKWKELEGSDENEIIDENWLRFYWQQILLAVNTIHEERIVHSDLKPANFLLVRGSLKLIDFGIAKAIMSDTTNIQRDSQVGTLSYMSPEAFMCNETDSNGNTIKCGRSSDIWSLGCILYQMVYGRTPFSEYKTFWAKFKVITDPAHEIIYEPVKNPWLLDLMKKCLSWDRNARWRIPELLQHPFLVPYKLPGYAFGREKNCTLFQLIAESSANDEKVMILCSHLQGMMMMESGLDVGSDSVVSREELRKFLGEVSSVCSRLQDELVRE